MKVFIDIGRLFFLIVVYSVNDRSLDVIVFGICKVNEFLIGFVGSLFLKGIKWVFFGIGSFCSFVLVL